MSERRTWTWSSPLIGADRDATDVAERLLTGTSVMIAGARGSGRSHVLRAVIDELRMRGVAPVVVRPSAALSDLPLAALEAAGDVRASALAGDELPTVPPAIFVVDDLQSLDHASATALARAISAGRATALVALMVPRARARPVPRDAGSAGPLFLRLWLDGFADRVDLTELTTPDAERLVSVFLGSTTLDAATTASLIWRADGSRTLLRELVSEAVQASTAGRDPLAAVRDTAPHSRLSAALELHVADLSEEDRRCLAFLHQVPHIALADATRFLPVDTLQALVTAGLVHIDNSAARRLTANESLAHEATRQLGDDRVDALVDAAAARMLAEADEWWSAPLAVVVADRWHRGRAGPGDADPTPVVRARVALDAARAANDRGDVAHTAAHAARGLRAADTAELRLEQAFALARLFPDDEGDPLASVDAETLDAAGRRRRVRLCTLLADRGLPASVNPATSGDTDDPVERDLEIAARAGSTLEWAAAARAATRAASASTALAPAHLRALLSAGMAETFAGRWSSALLHFRDVERILDARTRPAGIAAADRLGAVLVLLSSYQLAGADGAPVRQRLAEERLRAARESDPAALVIAGIGAAIAEANVGRPALALKELKLAVERGPTSLTGADLALAELGIAEALAAAGLATDARTILDRSLVGETPLLRHARASVESTVLVAEHRRAEAVSRAREAAQITWGREAPAARLRDLFKLIVLGVITPPEREELDALTESTDLPLASETARRVAEWDSTSEADPVAQLRLHPQWMSSPSSPGAAESGSLSQLPLRTPSGASVAELTRREREIALLVVDGHTNREIAARLYLSVRTVESHVYQARAKIGATSRAELGRIVAQWAATRSPNGTRNHG